MKNIKILLFLACVLQVNIHGMFINKYNGNITIAKPIRTLSLSNFNNFDSNKIQSKKIPESSVNTEPVSIFEAILNNNKIKKDKILKEENRENENNNDYIPISLPVYEPDLPEEKENNGYILTRENGKICSENNLQIVSTPAIQSSFSNITSIDSSAKQLSSNGNKYLLDKLNSRQRKKNLEKISHFRNKLSNNALNNIMFTTNDIITLCDFMENQNENLTNLHKFFRNLAEQKIKINSVLFISLNQKLIHFKCLHKTNYTCDLKCKQNKRNLIKKLNKLKIKVVDEKYIELIGIHELREYITNLVKPEIEEAKDNEWKQIVQQKETKHEKDLKEKEAEHKQALSAAVEKTVSKYDEQLKQIRADFEKNLEQIKNENKHTTFSLTLFCILSKNFERKKLKTIFSELNENMKHQQKELNEALQQKEVEYKKILQEKDSLLKKQEEKITQKSRWFRRYPIPILSFFLGGFTFHVISNPTPYIPYFCLFLKGLSSFLRFFAPSKKGQPAN